MTHAIEKFVHIAGRHLLVFNLLIIFTLKVVLPHGDLGTAMISQLSGGLDTSTVVTDTNAARAAASLPPLIRNPLLDAAAAQKLSDMESKNYFEHVSPDGTPPWNWIAAQGYRYRAAGENLAKGFDNPDSIVAAWMQSPAHRANIVSTQYKDIGVAAKYVTINGANTMVVVEMFGSPLPVAAPAPIVTKLPVPPQSAVPVSQAVSTDRRIAKVSVPIVVPELAVTGTAQVSQSISSGLAIYLVGLMAILVLCVGIVGFKRSTGWALAGNVALLILVMVLPVATVAQRLIF